MQLFLPVFAGLHNSGVRYVTVGGIATVLHGYARLTGDIDIIIDLEDTNCRKALVALKQMGFLPRIPVALETFADPDVRQSWIDDKGLTVFSLHSPHHPLVEVDIFVEEPMPFFELWTRKDLVEIDGCSIYIASIDDIIALKQKADRPKDKQDIEVLNLLKNNG